MELLQLFSARFPFCVKICSFTVSDCIFLLSLVCINFPDLASSGCSAEAHARWGILMENTVRNFLSQLLNFWLVNA